jgi:hypothetical protein
MTRIHAAEIEAPAAPLRSRPDLVWMSTGVSIFGWGEALRLAAGFGPARFARAEAGLLDWIGAADADLGPGLEPVAFASFTFDDRSAGSVSRGSRAHGRAAR